jgi:hypothetical protein
VTFIPSYRFFVLTIILVLLFISEFERNKYQTHIVQANEEIKGRFSKHFLLNRSFSPIAHFSLDNKEIEARYEKLRNEEQNLETQVNEIASKKDLYKSLQDKNNENIKRFSFHFKAYLIFKNLRSGFYFTKDT